LLKQAAEQCDAALSLFNNSQTSPGLRSCSIAFAQLGNYRRAKDYVNIDSTSDFSHAILLNIVVKQGNVTEAVKLGGPHMAQWPTFEMLPSCVQHKPSTERAGLLRQVRASADPEINYLQAANLAYCGEKALAVSLLRRAVQGGYCSFPALDAETFFDTIRGEPDFAQIRGAGSTCQRNAEATLERALQSH
jgi:hypothetical protein